MVQQVERTRQVGEFPETAPAANPVFYRTYSRTTLEGKESWQQTCDRAVRGLAKLGKLEAHEIDLLRRMQYKLKSLPAGRWLWVGGTQWLEEPENFSGAYNCTSTNVVDWRAFGLIMDLAMMGCGTGAVLEPSCIDKLPAISNRLNVLLVGGIGKTSPEKRRQRTEVVIDGQQVTIYVGDSRQGWVGSYQSLLELSSDPRFQGEVEVAIDLSDIRPVGEPLKGFGGVANPIKLPQLYQRCAAILNKAIGRQLSSIECCLLIDEAATTIVAGNIRRSAGMRQGSSNDTEFADAKSNLWQQDEKGNWRIDPQRDALRMANHTRVFHSLPTESECIEAVRKQYYSGEGAIQWAPEALARANADLLATPKLKKEFLQACIEERGKSFLAENFTQIAPEELEHRMQRYALNPCGEIIGADFHCNLAEIHLNQIDPNNHEEQREAFTAGAISVASLLNHKFLEERYQQSRELDPIVGVSFTGLFDFFVHAFGVEWLRWWSEGRPETIRGLEFKLREREYLTRWREIVGEVVWDYCDRQGLKRPNRYTTVQPAGTKSLLTGASSGWHPPKAQRFIRRITFGKNDPVALACIDYGYNVVPSQSDRDEQGNLLDDPFSPLCSEWLVEIPVAVSWADLEGADKIDISKFSALAQFDFAMQVQTHYVTHNTSSTLELRLDEVEPLGKRIHQAISNHEGYISAALLARFDDLQSFPRLPFEPIDQLTYDRLMQEVKARRKTDDFHGAIAAYSWTSINDEGPAGCDSDKCLFPEPKSGS